MRRMKRAVQLAIIVLCVVFTVSAIINVFADNTEVLEMAKGVACEGVKVKPIPVTAPPGTRPSDCPMAMTRMARTPIGQSFEFTGNGLTKEIECKRSLILVGSYSCVHDK